MTTPEALSALMAQAPALYAVPAGQPFLDEVCAVLTAIYADDPFAASKLTVFLPNRRAARGMAECWARHSAALTGAEAAMLPRLRSLGDVDESDLLFSGGLPAEALDLPPPIDGMTRRLLLAQLISRLPGRAENWPSILRAADDLAGLLDSFHTESVPFDALHTLIDDEDLGSAARHWEESLVFLRIVTEVWPSLLQERGQMDGALRQRLMLEALANEVEASETDAPMIVAGSLGTVAATGRFMAAVANKPNGLVILPGLDQALDARAWAAIDPPPPQAVFRERLDRDFGGRLNTEVPRWPSPGRGEVGDARRALLSLALRPAEATDDWHGQLTKMTPEMTAGAVDGLSVAVAATEEEEAQFVSLLIREALEIPGRRVMVVTADRALAYRITVRLKAWNITVDDSGGTPLANTYRGSFFRLVAKFLTAPGDPRAFLALLGHDLCAAGMAAQGFRQLRALADKAFRGPLRAGGWLWVKETLARILPDDHPLAPELHRLIADLDQAILGRQSASAFRDRLEGMVTLAEALACTPEEEGAARLWRYEDGEALASLLNDLLATDTADDISGAEDDAALIDALMAGISVRKRGGHPRLAVYGLLEARLQTADLVILAGLSEGVWPDAAPTDSFLSRPMRSKLGLPSPEQIIGRAGLDFLLHASAPEVVLTRAERRERSPQRPSRFMVRLESFLHHLKLWKSVDRGPQLRRLWAKRHSAADLSPATPPAPTPPVDARPTRLSVGDIERLIRDPFAIYAKHVLGLRPLDQVATPIGPRERGLVFHSVLEAAFHHVTDEGLTRLKEVTETSFAHALDAHGVPQSFQTLWGPAWARTKSVAIAYETQIAEEGKPLAAEVSGEWTIDGLTSPMRIHGRADRIDHLKEGKLSIVDFKTSGTPPTLKQSTKFSPQLAILGLMGEAGAFEGLPAAAVGRLSFVSLTGKEGEAVLFDKAHTVFDADMREYLDEANARLVELITAYQDQAQPYLSQPRPQFTDDYGDYDHLARRGEWATLGGGDD